MFARSHSEGIGLSKHQKAKPKTFNAESCKIGHFYIGLKNFLYLHPLMYFSWCIKKLRFVANYLNKHFLFNLHFEFFLMKNKAKEYGSSLFIQPSPNWHLSFTKHPWVQSQKCSLGGAEAMYLPIYP